MGALDIIFNDGKAEGRVEGRAEGEAAALLRVLRARRIAVDAASEARIHATHDLAMLERWLERAAIASTLEEVFGL